MIDVDQSSISPNSNCLEGKRCPECRSHGPFEVVARMRVLLYDNGIDDAKDGTIEYDGDARTICYSCRYEGQFGDFDE